MKYLIIYASVLYLILQPTNAQPQWKLVKDNDSIQVYFRDHGNSDLKEFRAVTTFKGMTLKDIEHTLRNANDAYIWSYGVKESKLLKRGNNGDDYVYFIIDTPWPMQKRDVVQYQKVHYENNHNTLICTSISKPAYIVPNTKYTRIEESEVYWRFDKRADHSIAVEYIFYSDPKVPVSDYILDKTMIYTPLQVLAGLEQFLIRKNTLVVNQ